MKKLFTPVIVMILTISVFAQPPQKMSYQCVVRNQGGELVSKQSIGVRTSILRETMIQIIVFQETYASNPATNENGLLTLQIGSGIASIGDFSKIDWSNGPYFLRTEMDLKGGTSYTISGQSQVLSVPYALYAEKSGSAEGYVPDARTLTINGTAFNLTANRSWNVGTVTSVGLSLPDIFSVSGSPVTAGGTLIATLALQPANKVFATHPSLAGPPSFRSLVATDIPGLDWNKITSGKPTTLTGYGITDAVDTTGNQTIGGIKTFRNDLKVNGLTVGKGKNGIRENTAVGNSALSYNTTGFNNTANGFCALKTNSSGTNNTAVGAATLYYNTTGHSNTANGAYALFLNTTGYLNTAIGGSSLYSNTTGYLNTANGHSALHQNTTGNNNTAIGYYSLHSNETGLNNTAIGYGADVTSGALTNATALGYIAIVNASNMVRIGNSAVTVIQGQVNWSVGSDIRLKDNVEYSDKLGLEFINRLKTAIFTYKNDSEKRHHDGLIAQDVQETLNKLGLNFSGIVESENDEKILNLSYAEFVIPLINSVKELSSKNQEQLKQIENQQERIDKLEALINNLSSGEIVQKKQ